MNTFATMNLLIQFLLLVAVAFTARIYFVQMRTMQDQLTATRESSNAQKILAVVQFLQSDSAREARSETFKLRSEQREYGEWTDGHKSYVSTVCSSYDTVGILIRRGIIPTEVIIKDWSPSIRACYETAKPHIEAMRRESGDKYWDDFEHLYRIATRQVSN